MNYLQIAKGIDVSRLCLELRMNPELWNQNTMRTAPENSPHHGTDDIFVRYAENPNTKEVHESVWYPEAMTKLPACRDLIFNIMRYICATRLGGVLIYRVAPGKEIKPHKDLAWHASYYEKFNLCLSSNDKARFYYEDQSFGCEPGDVHHFRNDLLHWVKNEGDIDYTIMTMCVRL